LDPPPPPIQVQGLKHQLSHIKGLAAVKKTGRTGRARTADLHAMTIDIRKRQTRLVPKAVFFGWVKAHNEVLGNEKADRLAKEATNLYSEDP